MILSLPVNPLAARIALMTASVPELTKRLTSMDGMSSLINSAKITSFSVGAPKVNPFLQDSITF